MSTMAPQEMTPLWWLQRLESELETRSTEMRLMESYYVGDHPMPFLTRAHESKLRDEFVNLLADSRSNMMRLVVDATEERLRVDGFRLSAAVSETADLESWRIWQANEMDAESQTGFLEALVKGLAYVSVWEGDPYPVLAVEDPLQTIVGYVPGSNFRRRAAALKLWTDDWTGDGRANVYLPDGIHKFRAKAPAGGLVGTSKAKALDVPPPRWEMLEEEFVPNPLGVVPIVPLRNRPRLLCEGESEIADVYRIQNQINGFVFLLALAGYFGAHRQRWATGIPMHEDEKTGKPVEPFNVAIDRLFTSEDPNTRFGEFGQTDLSGYISSIEQKIKHIANITRTPRHYLVEEGQSPSGDALRSAESGLTKKVERKQRPFGEGLEEALRIARMFQGHADAPVDSEIVWADPEIRTEAEITDAAIKRWAIGLTPWQQTMEDLGYSETQIARMLDAFGGTAPSPVVTTPAVSEDPAAA